MKNQTEVKHRRQQAMIVMAISDSAFTFTPRLCRCRGLGLSYPDGSPVPHVHHLSRRCHG
jgi:hypothetical protein